VFCVGEAIGQSNVSPVKRRKGSAGEERRREKSLRNGVHHANGVVWEAVSPALRRRALRGDARFLRVELSRFALQVLDLALERRLAIRFRAAREGRRATCET
jgi:hypothetical protein